jgi:hypothetical protein
MPLPTEEHREPAAKSSAPSTGGTPIAEVPGAVTRRLQTMCEGGGMANATIIERPELGGLRESDRALRV